MAAGKTTGYVAAREADEEAGAENRTLRRRILAMPARTMDGLLLKARVARWCFMDDEDEIARHLAGEAKDSAAVGETMAFSILLDLARMVSAEATAMPARGAASNLRPVPMPADRSALRLGADAAGDVREWYRSWLYAELRLLNLELDGSPEISAIRQDNPGAKFHFPRDMGWRDVPKPSTRAAAVLGLLGLMPETADAVPVPAASAA